MRRFVPWGCGYGVMTSQKLDFGDYANCDCHLTCLFALLSIDNLISYSTIELLACCLCHCMTTGFICPAASTSLAFAHDGQNCPEKKS